MIPNALEIRRLRKEASLSQRQLAELARIDERTISRIENERRPQRRERYVLETVARVLGEILGRPITVYDITLPDPDDAPAPPENLWGRVVLCVAAAGPKRGGKGDRPVFAEHGGGKEALIGVYYLNDLNLDWLQFPNLRRSRLPTC